MEHSVQGNVISLGTRRLSFDVDTVDPSNVPAFLRNSKIYGDIEPTPRHKTQIQEETKSVIVMDPEPQQPEVTEMNQIEEPTVLEAVEPIKPVLDGLTVEELKKQQEEIQRAILEKQKAEQQDVIRQIVEVVNTYKIPIEDLVEALGGVKVKRKGVKATLKYRDPVTGAQWSGRGKEPNWIRGQDRNKFLIS